MRACNVQVVVTQVCNVNMLVSGVTIFSESSCEWQSYLCSQVSPWGEQATRQCEAGLGNRTLSGKTEESQRTLNHRSSCKHIWVQGSSASAP